MLEGAWSGCLAARDKWLLGPRSSGLTAGEIDPPHPRVLGVCSNERTTALVITSRECARCSSVYTYM